MTWRRGKFRSDASRAGFNGSATGRAQCAAARSGAAAFGLRISAYDPFAAASSEGGELADLPPLMADPDFVAIRSRCR